MATGTKKSGITKGNGSELWVAGTAGTTPLVYVHIMNTNVGGQPEQAGLHLTPDEARIIAHRLILAAEKLSPSESN